MEFFEEKVQVGFERTREGVTRVGFGARPRFTAEEIAGLRLFKALEKYPEFTQAARSELQAEFIDFDDLPNLSMDTFSAVLAFLKLHPSPVPEDFKDDNILPYFGRLIPDKEMTEEERELLIVRLKAEFVKYITAINQYRREIVGE